MKEREVLKLTLVALKELVEKFDSEQFTSICELDEAKEAIEAAEEALAQPEQEPVAFLTNRRQRLNVEFNATGLTLMPKSVDWKIPLYTTPPQRTWVGLTDDEIVKAITLSQRYRETDIEDARTIEALLKEKNT